MFDINNLEVVTEFGTTDQLMVLRTDSDGTIDIVSGDISILTTTTGMSQWYNGIYPPSGNPNPNSLYLNTKTGDIYSSTTSTTGTISTTTWQVNPVMTITGAKGDDGAPGLSAYQVATANGYTGTVTQWLASLSGTNTVSTISSSSVISTTANPSISIGTVADTAMAAVTQSQFSTKTTSLSSDGLSFTGIINNSLTGNYYSDKGSKISRVSDRLFMGSAINYSANSSRDTGSQDWLSTIMSQTPIGGWAMQCAQSASLAQYGSSGFVTGSRTSDAVTSKLGFVPSTIGMASWAIADATTNPTTATAYAYYGEGWRMTGVNYQPTFCMELEAVNLGGSAYGISTPYHPNCGGGTYCIQLGSGGGQSTGTTNAEAGIVFVSNPTSFNTGIIFSKGSLANDDIDAGVPINMATGHIIKWSTPETVQNVMGANQGFTIQSQVDTATQGSRIIAQNNAFVITNANGNAVFTVNMPSGDPTNTLRIESGTGTGAAAIYAAAGKNGSANLGLYPDTGGELQISSPVVASGSSLTDNPIPEGWLHININGTDYRIPLFTPAQAGG